MSQTELFLAIAGLIVLELYHLKWIWWEHWLCRSCGTRNKHCSCGPPPGGSNTSDAFRLSSVLHGYRSRMSVITTCIEPGCSTLCMGLFCIKHDARPQADFPRGRPWPPAPRSPHVTVVPVPVVAGAPETALTSVRPAA